MDAAAAFHYVEHPLALARDVPESQRARVLRAIDRIVKRERAANSLAWQAYEARRSRVPAIGTIEAAEQIVAMKRLGAAVPPLPGEEM